MGSAKLPESASIANPSNFKVVCLGWIFNVTSSHCENHIHRNSPQGPHYCRLLHAPTLGVFAESFATATRPQIICIIVGAQGSDSSEAYALAYKPGMSGISREECGFACCRRRAYPVLRLRSSPSGRAALRLNHLRSARIEAGGADRNDSVASIHFTFLPIRLVLYSTLIEQKIILQALPRTVTRPTASSVIDYSQADCKARLIFIRKTVAHLENIQPKGL